jgi:hypothetical protein
VSFDLCQLIFLSANFLLWTVAYVLMIHRSWKDRMAGIPLLAICMMLSFEVIFVFVEPAISELGSHGASSYCIEVDTCGSSGAEQRAHKTCKELTRAGHSCGPLLPCPLCTGDKNLAMGPDCSVEPGVERLDVPNFTAVAEAVWLVLDIVLFVLVLLYGASRFPFRIPPPGFAFWAVLTLAMVFAGTWTSIEIFDMDESGTIAFIGEAVVAVLFVPYVLRSKTLKGISYAGMWARAIADGMLAVAALLFSPWCNIVADGAAERCVAGVSMCNNLFMIWLIALWTVADVIVLVDMSRKRKQLASTGAPPAGP